ncbi:MAG: DNA repair protein RecN [Bacteroidales bacterium]|nr:DNA repair protein RecN [Bacteroidales bacterium]
MLQHLTIENYALIKSLDINFAKGFTTITGETGSGKSIILGALGLLLGQRADVQVLFEKDRKCVVEATFDIKGLDLMSFFDDNDLDYDDTLLLRREIQPSGKSRAFVNDTPASLQVMKELGVYILDIHSQHQTLTLKNSDFQLSLLDVMCSSQDCKNSYKQEYNVYKKLKTELHNLEEQERKDKADFDYHQFLFNELQQVQLQDGEQEQLEQEQTLLANAESIKSNLMAVIVACDDSDDAVVSRLQSCKTLLSKVAAYHSSIGELYNRFDSCLIELRDILSEIESIDSEIQYSPQRQEEVTQRLDAIYRLQTKHGVNTIAELLEVQNSLDDKLQMVSSLDGRIEEARKALSLSEKKLNALATQLTALRKEAATLLQKQIQPILSDLGMKDANFRVDISQTAGFMPTGCDEVAFMFNANKGGELREIGKVISGGELSRVMLAIKSLITSNSLLPTIIFDEIDTGVSGEISSKVGSIMKRMSATTQVFAITHLPQIAAKADSHLKVYKKVEADRTLSQMISLTANDRVEEIAKMLSADKVTESALATARELMNG